MILPISDNDKKLQHWSGPLSSLPILFLSPNRNVSPQMALRRRPPATPPLARLPNSSTSSLHLRRSTPAAAPQLSRASLPDASHPSAADLLSLPLDLLCPRAATPASPAIPSAGVIPPFHRSLHPSADPPPLHWSFIPSTASATPVSMTTPALRRAAQASPAPPGISSSSSCTRCSSRAS
jgi:hypothetical protein